MYIATVPNRNSPPAILLRESYREGGQVRTRTLANLTAWKPERLKALRRALKGDFDGMDGDPTSGPIFGVTFALQQVAQQVGLTQALGRSTEGKLILFLVLARIAMGGHAYRPSAGPSSMRWQNSWASPRWMRMPCIGRWIGWPNNKPPWNSGSTGIMSGG